MQRVKNHPQFAKLATCLIFAWELPAHPTINYVIVDRLGAFFY